MVHKVYALFKPAKIKTQRLEENGEFAGVSHIKDLHSIRFCFGFGLNDGGGY